ncbi:MAG: phosphoesterase, PA-phosphatase related [Tardiphaga sp.]|nr:phosphoesterase, PA-phosphatase related [Tardiphaga sp.]
MATPAAAVAPQGYFARLGLLVAQGLLQLVRLPSHSRRAEAGRALARRTLLLMAAAAVGIVALMFVLDAREITWMPPRGTAGLWPLRIVTEFGKGDYVLAALLIALAVIVLIAPRLRGVAHATLLGLGTRVQFLYLAVLLPILTGELLKVVVGRGRPFVGGEPYAFHFSHFSWSEAYASFPSGHATASCALAFAVSALWPRWRGVMIAYAVIVIGTRLVLLAHHPSDVLGGALNGVLGAMVVRYWFAARRLAFVIRSDGGIVPLHGPTPRQLSQAARQVFAA